MKRPPSRPRRRASLLALPVLAIIVAVGAVAYACGVLMGRPDMLATVTPEAGSRVLDMEVSLTGWCVEGPTLISFHCLDLSVGFLVGAHPDSPFSPGLTWHECAIQDFAQTGDVVIPPDLLPGPSVTTIPGDTVPDAEDPRKEFLDNSPAKVACPPRITDYSHILSSIPCHPDHPSTTPRTIIPSSAEVVRANLPNSGGTSLDGWAFTATGALPLDSFNNGAGIPQGRVVVCLADAAADEISSNFWQWDTFDVL